MSALHDLLLRQVVPALGVCTGTFMSFAPFRDVLRASREGHLGELNPTPWVFMLGNACGWVAYAYLVENVYVFLTNAPGFILAIWLNIHGYHTQTRVTGAIVHALVASLSKAIQL